MSVNNPIFNTRLVTGICGNLTATKSTVAVDAGDCGAVAFYYSFGTTTTGSTGTVTFTLEESDSSGSNFAAITGVTSGALTTDTGGMDAKKVALSVSCVGRKRYIRATMTVSGTVATGATGPEFAGGVLIASNPPVTTVGSSATFTGAYVAPGV